jgi:deazaflavin-dependent oxidoreductase (nitroreductase family)
MASPYPDIRWGTDTSPLRRAAVAFANTTIGSWILRHTAGVDGSLLRASRGRLTVLGPIGAPTALVTTIGRHSGERRSSPLLYHREDPDIFVVGSNFGQGHHPAWTWNLLTDDRCWVEIGGTEVESRATLLEGDERDRVYAEFEGLVEVYRTYRGRTDRDIRVFRLSAV